MWAFSDESERANVMLVTVVLVPSGAVNDARHTLEGLLLAGQRRVHTAKESPRRRRAILDAIAGIDGLGVVVLRYRRTAGVDRVDGRHLLLQAAAGLVVSSGATTWTLDDQEPVQRARDRASIAHALTASTTACTRPMTIGRPEPSRCCGPPTPSAGRSAPRVTGDAASPPVVTVRDIRP